MKLGINGLFSQKKIDAENLDGQKYERFLSFETLETTRDETEVEVPHSSRYDKFFDDDGTDIKLHDAFDSFDEVVFVDDKTRVNFDDLDNELATREYYK